MDWTKNAIMFWSSDNGATWNKITDHGRDALSISIERLESKSRMVDGTLRRYSIPRNKKRTFSLSWNNLPSKSQAPGGMVTVDGGWGGEQIENFHNEVDGSFLVKLRKGQDIDKATADESIEIVEVMIADYSKDIVKRGKWVDIWSMTMSLEEV